MSGKCSSLMLGPLIHDDGTTISDDLAYGALAIAAPQWARIAQDCYGSSAEMLRTFK
jgi:hypothetical protein